MQQRIAGMPSLAKAKEAISLHVRVLRSDMSASKCLQDDRGSLQHDVYKVGPVLEQTTLKECASAAVFQPSVTSNPILNNELAETDAFCKQSFFSKLASWNMKKP